MTQKDLDWENFDRVTETLIRSAETATTGREHKDASDALAELLGLSEKAIFRSMSIEQQNKFLKSVVNNSSGMSPKEVAQQLLQGLHIRTPTIAPPTPSVAFGMRGPAGPALAGMGGGSNFQQTQQQFYTQEAPKPLFSADEEEDA